MVHATERRGWSWAIWDYKGGFAVRDAQGNGTPVLAGLFAK
jgi:endoglucanase